MFLAHNLCKIDNMVPLACLEDEPKSGAILVYLFVSATLRRGGAKRI